ncbi:MAG: hypothetical protein AABM42_13355 [Actinomycetota bacterium]
MPDEIHAAVDPLETAGFEPPIDRAIREARLPELRARHHSVLPLR